MSDKAPIESLFNIVDKMTLSVDETMDGFVFSCIKPWIEYHTNYQFKVSKPLLIRALMEFRKNNPEEFDMLSKIK